MRYNIIFTPEAQEQLAVIYRFIATAASPKIAERYTGAIVRYCEEMQTFPQRGNRRDDIRPGLRITNYKKRTVIAFSVDAELVSIIGIFYGGQDYGAIFEAELGDQLLGALLQNAQVGQFDARRIKLTPV